jgi:hypothetical protein
MWFEYEIGIQRSHTGDKLRKPGGRNQFANSKPVHAAHIAGPFKVCTDASFQLQHMSGIFEQAVSRVR